MNNKISIVIRTYNEIKHIKEVLESLERQTYRNFDIVVVDSGSDDGTLDIVKNYKVSLVSIDKNDFNYSYASNVGVANSDGNIVCFLSGHSVPAYSTYLEEINNVFSQSNIGAIYGDVIALADGSFHEKLYNYLGYLKNNILGSKNKMQLESKIHPGIFSCSNAAARKELLNRHPFQEELGQGGEDIEVAYRIIQDGYFIAKTPHILVKHSHGVNFRQFLKQLQDWKKMYSNVLNYIDGEKHCN
ncbi:glycosyltransferase [Leuconostoc gelidum subsp. gasicomitatum]|uniref:glycosyltransferase family 2 protein n=1 Tax=Leuconostoc gelidum group TaxID=3016637 RepID=UPI001CC4EE97|nr:MULTISPECIES: glycosyltransferase [Leuconostoc gelidum group]MBZ5964365.1 glycosyltransferase [Leuconostoc gelidum subsp. gelidum]MBZ5996176.1 glycosyltransferase [Leuconostoc gasicomitatum]